MKRYDNQRCEINLDLLKNDEYCFFVLSRILQGECRLTITDNKRIIVCHSCDPYPVWIWLPDDATVEEMEQAYVIARDHFDIENHRFNMKYSLAEYIIRRATEDGLSLKIAINMLAYSCPNPIEPTKKVNGRCVPATSEDVELVASYMDTFHIDCKVDIMSKERYREKAKELIEDGRLFFWLDGDDKVAMCSYGISGEKGSINNVFTRTDMRRKGYAANIVYQVTKIVEAQGKLPVLYTDADYAASNACYEGIGYIKQGSLCTLDRK